MARRDFVIAHLIHIDPKQAEAKIIEALTKAQMHMGNTARSIGCTHGTLLTWIHQLQMENAVDKLRKKALKDGWYHDFTGGRPKMTAKQKAEAKARRDAMTPAQIKAARAKRAEAKAAREAASKRAAARGKKPPAAKAA